MTLGKPTLQALAAGQPLPRKVSESLAAFVHLSSDLHTARGEYLAARSIGADEHRRRMRFHAAHDSWYRACENLLAACLRTDP